MSKESGEWIFKLYIAISVFYSAIELIDSFVSYLLYYSLNFKNEQIHIKSSNVDASCSSFYFFRQLLCIDEWIKK